MPHLAVISWVLISAPFQQLCLGEREESEQRAEVLKVGEGGGRGQTEAFRACLIVMMAVLSEWPST